MAPPRVRLSPQALADILHEQVVPPSPLPPVRRAYQKRKQFVPSPQQAAFLDWVSDGSGSCILEAVAGAGKTTTLIEALRRMVGSIFFGAYNKKISDEIKLRVVQERLDRPGLFVSTLHGAGFFSWRKIVPHVRVDDRKVGDILKTMAQADPAVHELTGFLAKMVSFGKQFLMGVKTPSTNSAVWRKLAEHFGADQLLPIRDDAAAQAQVDERAYALLTEAFERSAMSCREVIDFDDMIYAPIRHGARFYQNDWVLVDECQDINPARRELARRMLKPNGRLVAVGDSRQAIYGFTGAGADSIERIAEEFQCTRLPLTVTYRCPKAVVRFAQQWVSHIEAHPSAPEGIVRQVICAAPAEGEKARPWFLQDAPSKDDAVLCRYTRPLVDTAFAMLREGVACKVEGRDIGKGLVQLARRWKALTSLVKLDERLGQYLEREVAKAKAKENSTREQTVIDQVATLRVFIARCHEKKLGTIDALVAEIEALFADDVSGVVTLATGHKSKGREWPRVYWLQQRLRGWNLKEWHQLVQEANLNYVISTRAQEELILVPEAPR